MINFVRISKFSELTGYSDDAVRAKIKSGVWREGSLFVRAPDGAILISLEGYDLWAQGRLSELATLALNRMASAEKRARRASGSASTAAPETAGAGAQRPGGIQLRP
jgi:hypothetical protein